MTKILEVNYVDDKGIKQQLKFLMPDSAVEITSIYGVDEAPCGAISFYEREPEIE